MVRAWTHLPALALLGSTATPAIASAQVSQVSEESRSPNIGIQVLDPDGHPLESAEVQIAGTANDPEGEMLISDADGGAVLDLNRIDPSQGAEVTVSAVGFRDAHVHVTREMRGSTAIRLERAENSGEIVVQAKRVSRPFSPSILGLLDIVTDARANADPVVAANDLPSSTNVAGNATLSLRATRPAISRLYLDDIPVFEFARGSNVDNATQSGSILNLGNTKDVEVYPSNPPLYLSGSTGGALRALPPTAATTGGNLAVNTAAVGLTGTIAPGTGGSFATLSGLYSDLQPQLSINETLNELVRRLNLRSVSLVARAALPGQSALSVFAQGETEDGRYPVELFGTRQDFQQTTDRLRAISSYVTPLGGNVLTVNAAYTRSQAEQAFGGWSSYNANRYIFFAVDLGGEGLGSRLTYRLGLDADAAKQSSDESFASALLPIDRTAPKRVHNANTDVAAYLFAFYRFGTTFLMSAGARRIVSSELGSAYSVQTSATVTSADKRHKLIISAGRYFGVELPQFAYYGGIARSRSQQAEADYVFSLPRLRLGVSAYHSVEKSDRTRSALVDGRFFVFDDTLTGIGRRTRTTGVEVFTVVSPLDGMEVKGSVSRIRQRSQLLDANVRGSNDFGYVVRGSVRYQIDGWGLNFAATAREGAPFTRITAFEREPDGDRLPVAGPINGSRLPPYFSLDASIARSISLSPTIKPLAFFSINNLLDRRNASSQVLADDPGLLRLRSYPGRVLTAGISLNF